MPSGSRSHVIVFGLVLISLVVGAQLAYTDVGRETGARWATPTAVVSLDANADAEFVSLSADGAPNGGAVAWIERHGDTYRIRLAPLTTSDGTVAVGRPRTIARSQTRLATVRVAAAGDRTAVVWERAEASEVALWTSEHGRTQVVSPPDTPSLNEPGVAFDGDRVVVAWQAFRSGRGGFGGHLAVVDENVTHRRFGGEVGGEHSPTVVDQADGVALAWVDADDQTAQFAYARLDGSDGYAVGGGRSVGSARSIASFGSTGPPATVDAASLSSSTVVLRQDLGNVHVARVTDGRADHVPVLADDVGKLPRIAGGSDRWMATYITEDRSSGQDVSYAVGRTGVTDRGAISQRASNAVFAEPVFAGGPGAVWTETGTEKTLYASAYRPDASSGAVERLTATPQRFAFVGVAAPALGAVTMPLLPWVAAPFLVGFLVTTRIVLDAVAGAVAWAGSRVGSTTTTLAVRKRIREVPVAVPFALYVVANVALFQWLGGDGVLVPGVAFASPLALSAAALAATVPVAVVWRTESPWLLAAVYAFMQTTALWATALPGFL